MFQKSMLIIAAIMPFYSSVAEACSPINNGYQSSTEKNASCDTASDNYSRQSKMYQDIVDAYNTMGTFIDHEDSGRLNKNTHPAIFNEFMAAHQNAEGSIRRFNPSAPAFGYSAEPSARSIRQQMWGTMKEAYDAAKSAGDKYNSCAEAGNNSSCAGKGTSENKESPVQGPQNQGLITIIINFLLEACKTVGDPNGGSGSSSNQPGAQQQWQRQKSQVRTSENILPVTNGTTSLFVSKKRK